MKTSEVIVDEKHQLTDYQSNINIKHPYEAPSVIPIHVGSLTGASMTGNNSDGQLSLIPLGS